MKIQSELTKRKLTWPNFTKPVLNDPKRFVMCKTSAQLLYGPVLVLQKKNPGLTIFIFQSNAMLRKTNHTTFGNRFNSQTQCIICVTVRRRKARPAPAYQEKSEGLVCEAFRLLLVGNWLSHTSSSMIVLGKQVGEVWKIPRIPPRASPLEEYSEFPDFSSLFTQDYYKPPPTPTLLSGLPD